MAHGDAESVVWFYVVLVQLPFAVALMKERSRTGESLERISVHTRTIKFSRHPGREADGAFGISRLFPSMRELGVTVRRIQRESGRNPRNIDILVRAGRPAVIPVPDRPVLVGVFTQEDDAEAWRAERRERPLPPGL